MSVKEDKLILKGLSKMTPDDILVDNDDDIIKMLKNDTGLKEKIKNILYKYGKDNIIDFNLKTNNNSSDCNYTFMR